MKYMILGGLMLLSTIAQSGVITVNKTSDINNNNDGGCNLREAVTAANNNQAVDGCAAGGSIDIIIIDVNQAIQLNSEIEIKSGMSIRAPFSASTTVEIRAASNQRIFEVFPIQGTGQIFEFDSLKLVNGHAGNGSGGAIYIHNNQTNGLISQIFIRQCEFENNTGFNGGAIAITNTNTTAKVTIRDSTFTGNQATDNGGAIYIDEGTSAEMVLMKNMFIHNASTGSGGAVLIADTGDTAFSLQSNQFNHNMSDESGGALALFATNSPQVYLMDRNSFIGNTAADNGGALYVALDAQAWIYNSVMSQNMADRGGAISTVNAWLYLYHSSLARNTANLGANLYAYSGTLGSIGASILANPQGDENCAGATSNLNTARTLIDDSSCPFNNSSDRREDALLTGISFDDGLPALVPATDSSAIDAVPLNACLFYGGGTLDQDQQNNPRPIDGDDDNNSLCDIGAIEVAEGHDLLWSDGFGG